MLLVIIGATPEGEKELGGLIEGVRERAIPKKSSSLTSNDVGLRWGLSSRSPTVRLAFGRRRHGQRCWAHVTANVLNKLSKSQ